MNRRMLYSTILAGVLGFSTLCLFHTGAEALDLSEFTGADQKVITQVAPKAGGAILVKEKTVYGAPEVKRYVSQPTAARMSLTTIEPAAGGNAMVPPEELDRPASGGYLDRNTSTDASDPYAKVNARFNTPGGASAPVDGNPWQTTTLANGARVETLNGISPAAGGTMTPAIQVNSGASITRQTGRGSAHALNN